MYLWSSTESTPTQENQKKNKHSFGFLLAYSYLCPQIIGMNKKLLLIWCLLMAVIGMQAQKLTVEKMEADPMDLSASTQPRNDLNGNPCGLVKVQLAAVGAKFEGNVLGDVAYKTGEYWVYMNDGAYLLKIKHPNFLPLDLNFRDYGIRKVEGKCVYVLTLSMPQMTVEKRQRLIINYTPVSATVLVDAKLQRGNGHIEVELPVGEHSYVIAADGYASAEGTVKLNVESPRTITEALTPLKPTSTPVQTINTVQPAIVEQPQPIETSLVPSSSEAAIETFTVNGVSFNMIRVDGGTFQMGSEDGPSDEQPVHQVTLSTYSIGETEVTQQLWEAVMGNNPSSWKRGNLPVEYVNWNECQTFIQKLNQLTGKRFRLPTEAEWEFAARGGNMSREFKYSGSYTIDDVAWYEGNGGYKTHDIKTKQPNELGLYDVSGNVWEWCQDWYGDYSTFPQTNPTGPSSASHRVIRGGSWNFGAGCCQVSFRSDRITISRSHDLGLRLAL